MKPSTIKALLIITIIVTIGYCVLSAYVMGRDIPSAIVGGMIGCTGAAGIGWFSVWKRRRSGEWTINIDRYTGFYTIINHRGGITYVEADGQTEAGGTIELPRGCRKIMVTYI